MLKYTLLFLGSFSLVSFIHALRIALRDRNRSLVSVTGRVVEYERKRSDDTISFTPVYEYSYAGRTYRGKHRVSSSKYGAGMNVVAASKYEIGGEIPLLVDENEPGFSITDDGSKSLNVIGPLLFLAFGAVSFFFAIRMF